MNRKHLLITIFAVLMPFSGSLAQEVPQPTVPVNLAQAIKLAIKKRPELRIERQREVVAQSKVNEAKGNFLPTLDLQGSSYYVNHYDDFTGINVSGEVANEPVSVDVTNNHPNYQLSGKLELGYNVYTGGRDTALLSEAKNHLEAARHQRSLTLRKVQLEVANAYWGLKKAQIRYAIEKRALEFVVLMEVKVAQTKHQVDRASELEYEAAMLEQLERETALKQADRDCLRAFDDYLHALSENTDARVRSAEQIPNLVDIPGNETHMVAASQIHPEIQHLNSELRAVTKRVKVEASRHLPKIDIFADYSLVGRDPDTYFGSWENAKANNYALGVRVSMNIFNGNRTMERIAQADAQVRIKRLELLQKEKALAQAHSANQMALDKASDALRIATAHKKLADMRRKVAESQLESGKISELEYRRKTTDADNAVDQATIARIDVVLADHACKLMVLE